jgi:hypothetical protein
VVRVARKRRITRIVGVTAVTFDFICFPQRMIPEKRIPQKAI